MVQEKTNDPTGTLTSGIIYKLKHQEDWFGLL
jgi:hypothetical protein